MRASVAVALLLMSGVVPASAYAQPKDVSVLNSCITGQSIDGSSFRATNNCGVAIHAYAGPAYDAGPLHQGRALVRQATDLNPGESWVIRAPLRGSFVIGCPFTPYQGHPSGYKLAYNDPRDAGNAVTAFQWQHDFTENLTCMLW
jgi:hypothetical protein